MTQGKKGRGDHLRFVSYRGADAEASKMAGRAAEAEGRRVDTNDMHRRAHMIGILAIRECKVCTARLPCQIHDETVLARALGIETPGAEDPAGENRALSDLWIAKWLEHYGTPEERAAGKPAKPVLTIGHFAALAKARKDHGFVLLRDAIDGIFADAWSTRKKRPSLYAVIRDPATFAAYLVHTGGASKPSGTLQREGAGA